MPVLLITDNELLSLFEDVKDKTDKFSELDPHLLHENPRIEVVFRFLLNKSLKEMGKLLDRSYATISQYERGNIKKIPLDEARKMSKILLQSLRGIKNSEVLLENFNRLKILSQGGVTQALRRAETMNLTQQEIQIRDYLHSNDIPYQEHITVTTDIGPLNLDFQIGGNIFVECTTSRSKWKAESMGFRALKLKHRYGKVRMVAVVPNNVGNGFRRRLVDYDLIVSSDSQSLLVLKEFIDKEVRNNLE